MKAYSVRKFMIHTRPSWIHPIIPPMTSPIVPAICRSSDPTPPRARTHGRARRRSAAGQCSITRLPNAPPIPPRCPYRREGRLVVLGAGGGDSVFGSGSTRRWCGHATQRAISGLPIPGVRPRAAAQSCRAVRRTPATRPRQTRASGRSAVTHPPATACERLAPERLTLDLRMSSVGSLSFSRGDEGYG
jgi:hypothetical protein